MVEKIYVNHDEKKNLWLKKVTRAPVVYRNNPFVYTVRWDAFFWRYPEKIGASTL